mmetsp:Transcript_19395/g.61558  ORF Transcript_19395/g.61558 Transcript_19395/m.61558 type:complete len:285 (+) Transcript_19395:77-931(+)
MGVVNLELPPRSPWPALRAEERHDVPRSEAARNARLARLGDHDDVARGGPDNVHGLLDPPEVLALRLRWEVCVKRGDDVGVHELGHQVHASIDDEGPLRSAPRVEIVTLVHRGAPDQAKVEDDDGPHGAAPEGEVVGHIEADHPLHVLGARARVRGRVVPGAVLQEAREEGEVGGEREGHDERPHPRVGAEGEDEAAPRRDGHERGESKCLRHGPRTHPLHHKCHEEGEHRPLAPPHHVLVRPRDGVHEHRCGQVAHEQVGGRGDGVSGQHGLLRHRDLCCPGG